MIEKYTEEMQLEMEYVNKRIRKAQEKELKDENTFLKKFKYFKIVKYSLYIILTILLGIFVYIQPKIYEKTQNDNKNTKHSEIETSVNNFQPTSTQTKQYPKDSFTLKY
jgi:predicted histidine transporter YuiF (NhaC family)